MRALCLDPFREPLVDAELPEVRIGDGTKPTKQFLLAGKCKIARAGLAHCGLQNMSELAWLVVGLPAEF